MHMFSQCAFCAHQRFDRKTTLHSCAAYPRGIPDRIAFNEQWHSQVLSDQQGTDTWTPAIGRPTPPELKSALR